MTHDELLAEITKWAETSSINSGLGNALRAVVELHKPTQDYFGGDDIVCRECSSEEFEWIYPCPTIQAIEKELG